MGILKNMAMSAVVASTMIGEASAEALTKDEIIGFRGVFCRTEDSARTLTNHFLDVEKKEVSVECVMGESVIKVIKRIETKEDWNIIEVETPDENRHYIVTKVPFKNKGMDINYEEVQHEQSQEI